MSRRLAWSNHFFFSVYSYADESSYWTIKRYEYFTSTPCAQVPTCTCILTYIQIYSNYLAGRKLWNRQYDNWRPCYFSASIRGYMKMFVPDVYGQAIDRICHASFPHIHSVHLCTSESSRVNRWNLPTLFICTSRKNKKRKEKRVNRRDRSVISICRGHEIWMVTQMHFIYI